LKRPTDTLGLGRGEIIHIVPISHTKEAAQRVVFQGITRKLFLAPFWKGRFEVTKEEIRFPGKDIIIIAGGSNESAALGLNVWAALMDEGNFYGKHKKGHQGAGGRKEDKSESIYDSLRRRIQGTYAAKGLHGRLFMISSKKSIHDFTERRLREAVNDGDTNVFVRDYCLAAETQIPLLDGSVATIKELAEKYTGSNDRFDVYSVDLKTKLVVPGRAHHPRLTKRDEPVIKITLDNRRSIRATTNHPFMLRSGIYKRAEDLVVGDSLMPLYRRLTQEGYEEIGQPGLDGEWQMTHKTSVLSNTDSNICQILKKDGQFSRLRVATGLTPYEKLKTVQKTTLDKSPNNHTITTIELGGTSDVYDLSVDEYENFAVNAGVFVHNSTWDVRPGAFAGQKWWRAAVSQKIGRVRVLDDNDKPEKDEIWFDFPDEYYREFMNDPSGAARDIAGIALESFRPFFSNREAINDMQKPSKPHPFHVYEWITSREITPIWENIVMNNVHGDPVPRCCPNAHRHCHMDLSKNRDATGLSIGHVAGETTTSRLDPVTQERVKEDAPLIHIDLCLRIMPPHAGEIEHELVRGLIYTLRKGGLPIKSVSADRWMGLPNLQLMSRHGFKTQEISTQRTLDPYLSAQSAMYERRIESPIYTFLTKELRELELNDQGTKVDHPKTGCFAGDTKVRLIDGRSLTFKQLVDHYGNGEKFYTYTIRNGAISAGVAYAPRLTAKNAKVVAVKIDNGQSIRCTPDHRFMMRDASYREAKDLKSGDSLMPLYTKRFNSDRKIPSYEIYLCPKDGRWHKTSRIIDKWKSLNDTENQPYHPAIDGVSSSNHKILSVKPDGRADVYDLSVEETSNFALDAGIFVHNSKDLADAFVAVVYYLSKNWQSIGIGGVSKGVSTMEQGTPGTAVPTSDGNFRWPDEPPLPKDGEGNWSDLPTWII
jgi:intein/homing endonuclease